MNNIKTKENFTKAALNGFLAVLFLGCILSCSKSQGNPDNNSPIPSDTSHQPATASDVTCWLTSPDQNTLLQKQNISLVFTTNNNQNSTITVDSSKTYQSIDGFGFALTGGSAYLINKLPAEERNNLLHELFASDSGCIGISYIRVSIGASDLSRKVFSYDDLPEGQTDTALKHFDLGPDKEDLIPVLKAIVQINPDIRILGSPWSAPVWMKTNHSSVGGSLDPKYYQAYADYFVKYIKAMAAEGIHIDAVTPQNEPMNPKNNPSMQVTSDEEKNFVADNLGPAFQSAGLDTKIIIWDHNCDMPQYPLNILADQKAYQYVAGSAFHLYAGDISALTQVHNAYPDKNVYFTEQWIGGPSNFKNDLNWSVSHLIIGATRNWSKNVLEWNLASDPDYNPHTPGGCTSCEGALTIGSGVRRNVSYYIIAHASKFVKPGSERIMSDEPADLPNVAFKTPDGKKVLIVINTSATTKAFNIGYNNKTATTSLAAGAVATYVW